MTLRADYHAHSNYSDGRPLPEMIEAAERAGLDAVGITDHCNVSTRSAPQRAKRERGFNLDLTRERRREAIERLRREYEIEIYDGVELDYDPRDEPAVESFLAETDFDYAIGSVHELEDECIFERPYFVERSESERRDLVDDYYRKIVALLEFDGFDVLGHVDAIERTPELRGYAIDRHYERVADALVESSTIPEINAGKVGLEYGEYHPSPEFLDHLLDREIRFVPGTDSHRPDELVERVPLLGDRFAELDLDPATPLE